MAVKENKFLTIDGDIVRVEKRIIERTVRTTDFLAELARYLSIFLILKPLLPYAEWALVWAIKN